MFDWLQNQIRQHGVIAGGRMFVRVYSARLKTLVANKVLPAKVACPCCGWKGRKFYEYLEYKVAGVGLECPQCNSHARHRAFYLWLKNDFELQNKGGNALVCAPEKALEPLWQSNAGLRVIKSDLEPSRSVNILADLQELPFPNDSLDIIWCHHVLEQIKDDRAALSELHRVLRPSSGRLIISSGMSGENLTEEYGFSNPTMYGNWRLYGKDYPARLAEYGFKVERIDYNLSPLEAARYGINAQENAYICQK